MREREGRGREGGRRLKKSKKGTAVHGIVNVKILVSIKYLVTTSRTPPHRRRSVCDIL